MSEEAATPPTLVDRLNKTGTKLSELTKKASVVTKAGISATAEASKSVVDKASEASKVVGKKAADASRNAVSKANTVVQTAVEDTKAKREARREEKISNTKEALRTEPLFNDVPPMVVLPEFEQERIAVVNEQQVNQLLLLEEMQRLSSRVDSLEKRNQMMATYAQSKGMEIPEEIIVLDHKAIRNQQFISTSDAMGEILHILGASLLFIVALVGLDQAVTDQGWMIAEIYPADLAIWAIGAFAWVMYLLHRLIKAGLRIPMLIRIQTGLAVGITTLMGLMMNNDSMSTVSNVWTWGTVLAIGLLLGGSMVATAWRSTKRLVGIRETIELIE
ncbi:MAG: hypothetical protein QNL85_05285 [Euryarchaeota archaeon]